LSRKKVLAGMVLALFLVLPFFVTAFATQTDILTIDALGSGGWSFNLQRNEKISGEVFISHSIKFWITDPDGFIIQNFGVINQTTPYEFTATKAGKYSLMFQSMYFGETQVQASYNVERPSAFTPNIPDGVSARDVFSILTSALVISILSAIVVVAIVGSLLFLVVRWLKKRYTNR